MNLGEIEGPFILDSNVFIEAHRRYYGLDLCPGFWAALKHYFKQGSLCSLDKIRAELEGEDGLWTWISGNLPNEFFHATDTGPISGAFGELVVSVMEKAQYKPAAKAEFANVADGWLPAYAMVNGGTVVTHEEPAPQAQKKVPLPNICEEFEVPYIDTFEMLRALEAKFHWNGPNS